jgi:plastocyanin
LKKTVKIAVNLIIRQIQSPFMKQLMGLLILVIVLAAVSGCTQPATPPAPETTLTTVPTTEVTIIVTTPVPVTAATTIAAANVTASVTTAAAVKPTITPSTKVTTIHIRNNTFVPDQLTVLPGTGITWINDDFVTHVVKATGNSTGKFTSAELINGANFHYTFGAATGTFEFGDPKYPDMKGAIIVVKGDAVVGY